MDNFNIDDFINMQRGTNNLSLSDLPDIDLYMDQVMQLFENKLSSTKRNNDDKVLTKTMINNYAKGNLLMKIKNKKYTKAHMILMSLIYNLKGSLSLTDIKTLLTPIINSFESDEDYPLEDVYESFLELYDFNLNEVKNSSHGINNEIQKLVNNKEDLGEFEEKFLQACSLITMSNLYRRMGEKLIDECFNSSKEEK